MSDVYVLYEVDYDYSKIVGIFTTKEKAEMYLRNHSFIEDAEDTQMYFKILKKSLDPENEMPNKISVYGYAHVDYNSGETDLYSYSYGYDIDSTKAPFDTAFGKSEFNDDVYLFKFSLDVSKIDKNTSMEDYRKYIKEEIKKYVSQNLKGE